MAYTRQPLGVDTMVTDRTRLAWIVIPLACLIILPGVGAAETIGFGPAAIWISPGDTVPVDIVLAEAPSGISGYRMTVTIEPEGVAVIDSVRFPGWAGFASATGTPGAVVRITGVDLNGTVERNSRDMTLATLTLRGTGLGNGTIRLSDPFFDNLDEHVVPATVNGTILVGSSPGAEGTNRTGNIGGTPGGGSGAAQGSSSHGTGSQGGSGSPSPGSPPANAVSTLAIGSGGTMAPSGDVSVTSRNFSGSPEGPGSQVATSPPHTAPAGGSPAGKGIPFLSLPGLAAAIGAIVLAGSWIRREKNGN